MTKLNIINEMEREIFLPKKTSVDKNITFLLRFEDRNRKSWLIKEDFSPTPEVIIFNFCSTYPCRNFIHEENIKTGVINFVIGHFRFVFLREKFWAITWLNSIKDALGPQDFQISFQTSFAPAGIAWKSENGSYIHYVPFCTTYP